MGTSLPRAVVARLDRVAERTFRRLGGDVRLATPLGIGKPNPLVDAFYRQAREDPSLRLHVFTALSLARPDPSSGLERRLVEPVLDRVFGDYPDLSVATDHLEGRLPPNVRFTSFYYQPGSALGSPAAQRSYTSTNYTHVVRDLIAKGVNALAQMVAVPGPADTGAEAEGSIALSLSSNPDLTLDLLPWLLERQARGEDVALLAQVNRNLPFMYGDAVVPAEIFDEVIDDRALDFTLFAPPSQPVTDTEWAIGLHASALVRDGGTLQLGIGALGDAVARLLLVRHRDNARYLQMTKALGVERRGMDAPDARTGSAPPTRGSIVEHLGGTEPFSQGLYGASEMLMQGLLELLRGGVLTRPAEDGRHLHACFFLGPGDFYETLREMPPEERRRISMTRISYVNELFGDEARKRRERRHARFLNTGMVATLLGAVASDGLEDGRVVSGVGGQYNFVSMAHALEDGRSILMIRAVRESGGETVSNIRYSYGHVTIPRHLRDVVVTEYGAADLRGRPDGEVVKAMLSVADARFQDELLDEAREAGKIDPDWEIPSSWRDNTPERVSEALEAFRAEGVLSEYPFGTDLTEVEQGLARALRHLKRTASGDLAVPDLEDVAKTLRVPDSAKPYLERMGLADPEGVEERVLQRVVAYGLAAVDEI